MNLCVAMFVEKFPVISETFILRQMTGLLDLGHDLHIFADYTDLDSPRHPEVDKYGLLSRTISMNLPPEVLAEFPVLPLSGETWPPNAVEPVANWQRVVNAFPKFLRNALRHPKIGFEVLKPSEFRYEATSLSALYRLDTCDRFTKRVDICHAHFGPVGNKFRFIRRLWKAPLVVSFHGYDFSMPIRAEGPDLYQKLFAEADLITANSDYTRGRLEAIGCPSEKIRKLPVGLDLKAIRFKLRTLSFGERVQILSIGRLVGIKGHEFVIRAVAKLKQRGVRVDYHIVGDGVLRAGLQELALELGIPEEVHFDGALPWPAVCEALDRAHLFVMGSVNIDGDEEGQGLALQEAQAAGLPVVATDHGALREGLLLERSGFLVPERDVNAMAERLQTLIEHPNLWPSMGRAGHNFIGEHYDIRKLNVSLCDIYREAIHRFSSSKGNRISFGK